MYEFLKVVLARSLPAGTRRWAKPYLRKAYSLAFLGGPFECPIAERSFRRFIPISSEGGHGDLLCPWNGSISRYRLLWLYLDRVLNIRSRQLRILDFSPPDYLVAKMSALPSTYLTTGFEEDWYHRRLDITSLELPDHSFDLIICYHVLEHIPQDRQAMSELYRVLAPGGICLLQVPFQLGGTFEDASITAPADRLAHFGQSDHVRMYGRNDFVRRLEETGFAVTPIPYAAELGREAIERYVLRADEVIFRADKRLGPVSSP